MSSQLESQIAIVGIAGRFPQSPTLGDWWTHLRAGRELVSRFTDEELAAAGIDRSAYGKPNYVKAAAALGDHEIACFDAQFFGYSPAEAALMDPQHRLFLETAYHAFEDSGYVPAAFEGLIAVFASQTVSAYWLHNIFSNRALVESMGALQATAGSAYDSLATRVSYKMNLRGPSLTVQTACSSSLVAVHLACQSLLSGECDLALAGGVSLAVPQTGGYEYHEGGILSPDGHCRVFDANAKGTISGSGVGAVVLKRLVDALADADHIHAVILGSAANNDGSAKVGFTAPGGNGQAAVIRDALSIAGVSPEHVTYIEAHGTGTALGDPVEVAALAAAFRAAPAGHRCAIGSVKSNMGHLDAAAGIAGLLKTVLQLRHRELVPSLNFSEPNPNIDFASTPFVVNTRLSSWDSTGVPRRAGVSSFGMGGTNAHVVLEEPPEQTPDVTSRRWHVVPVSAKTDSALGNAAAALAADLGAAHASRFADIAYTMQVGRAAYAHRRAVVANSVQDAATRLRDVRGASGLTGRADSSASAVFMFPGQGSQYVGMGRDLYESDECFRDEIDTCARIAAPHLSGQDIRAAIYGESAASDNLMQTCTAQPALFAIGYALARTWINLGVRPAAMIGHSIGEYVAACISGVFTLEDVLALVAARGRLMQESAHGGMLVVHLDETAARTAAGSGLDIAAINAEDLCVLSGPTDAITATDARLREAGVETRHLRTSHAFHSRLMDAIVPRFVERVAAVPMRTGAIPFISNVTGTWARSEDLGTAHYWAEHLRRPVRFAEGIAELLRDPHAVFVEMGPGNTLSTLVRRNPAAARQRVVIASMQTAQEIRSDEEVLATAVARAWVAGCEVDWRRYHTGSRRRVSLSGYPFARTRHWISAAPNTDASSGALRRSDDVRSWFYVPSWQRTTRTTPDDAEAPCPWIVLADDGGLGTQVAALLRQRGNDVTCVKKGTAFEEAETGFVIDPRNREHYAAMVGRLQARGIRAGKIAHLWALDHCAGGAPAAVDIFLSVVHLAQALSIGAVSGVDVAIASQGLYSVLGTEQLTPEHAVLAGASLVIPQEVPGLRCRIIDLDTGPRADRSAVFVSELLSDEQRIIALRAGHRWAPHVEPIPLARPSRRDRIRRSGVYLITGGLGNVGLALAEHLASEYAARIVLTGRSEFPAKTEWDGWLRTHHDERDGTSVKLRRLQRMEASGAEVLVLRADVADGDAMQRVVRETLDHFGSMQGVIHAAGALSDDDLAYVQEMDAARAMRQFRSKITGLQVLDRVTSELELDFRIAISSLSAVLGGLRFAAYAAANAFVDAYVECDSRQGPGRWRSIDFDTWLFEQQHHSAPPVRELGMLPAEGVDAFERVLARHDVRRVVVSTGDLDVRMRQWLPRADTSTAPAPIAEPHNRPQLDTAYSEPRNPVDRAITAVWERFLGVAGIGIRDDFYDLGGHSLMATQILAELRELLRTELSLRDFFAATTVADLSDAIVAAESEPGWTGRILELREMVHGMSLEDVERALQERT